ncbi:SDR family NAD(P)-dependent oxidoreductase [Nonomuraea typhae]|uniref:SDR family NAD(P)-dependent oxidoreductase n=1 Tax=Nonomuraea typhae TaxID=2603600 RepID=UPI0012F97B2D|nr:SDR family NAD(P)-dependent oxidoreductase [Nonomuraea typhae]
MTGSLAGRTALITGAARGIGAAIATRMAAEGAHVALCDLDAEGARATLARIERGGGKGIVQEADVSAAEAARAVVAQAAERLGGLDILVNNAATGARAKIRDYSLEDWDRVLAVNLRAPFVLSQAAVEHLERSGAGAIVNICSVAVIGFFGQIAYDASKGGLLSLTRALAVELGRNGIRANAVCPGFVDTAMADHGNLREIAAKQTATQPIARMGRPEEIAGAVCWLASDEARYVTGQALFVDGGWVRA